MAIQARAFQTELAEAVLPDAPEPQSPSSSPTPQPNPCPATDQALDEHLPSTFPAAMAMHSVGEPSGVRPATIPCTRHHLNWYQRFVNGPQNKPLTPRDKGWLAIRNLADPFNLITIGGDAAISVAADSHSPYGPGMPGFARYVGVSFTQDLTGEFFGTFLIPSVAHQDPHYYRMQHAKIPRRIGHAIVQVLWSQGDNGKPMPNYANLIGFGLDDAISNLYVPQRETNAAATAQRYFIGLATAPIGNFINEFVPDVASHIHVQIVVIQRIINQVANKETAMGAASQ